MKHGTDQTEQMGLDKNLISAFWTIKNTMMEGQKGFLFYFKSEP